LLSDEHWQALERVRRRAVGRVSHLVLLSVQNAPTILRVAGVPNTTVEAQPLPRAAVMEQVIQALQAAP